VDADLDLLLTIVFCVADDLLPEKANNARRSLTDAEVITLLVAQTLMGIPSDRRFLRAARHRLICLFPGLVGQSGWHKRRARLDSELQLVMLTLARDCPGFWDDVVVIDSTPVETARSRETVKRAGSSALSDAIGNAAAYGYCPSHSRWFYGMRLHGVFGLDGTPRALMLVGADRPEREIALNMLPRALHGGETIIGDKNYSGRQFTADITALGGQLVRPPRKDEPKTAPRLSILRQRVESIFWTCKDLLSLERHGARTLHNLRVRISQRLLALTACIHLNHWLGRPSRAIADYTG
jgi:Transposase DDE domain